ncbi:hypothetical protein, conserved [Eimeria tenella]|uniref:Uncharacterized protein n=1 Tax=Eimeria tenella TaxID=5802 RepID=U6KHW4_EIMTE|nr:hypothetical protein, conserved [Eimeria tenella]CDJ37534.1 hypothetical protein, conserved [Eimeria tenella]|eukprot:XP_013228372.1 hypothetical protein, conserved [Eimeria tenella]
METHLKTSNQGEEKAAEKHVGLQQQNLSKQPQPPQGEAVHAAAARLLKQRQDEILVLQQQLKVQQAVRERHKKQLLLHQQRKQQLEAYCLLLQVPSCSLDLLQQVPQSATQGQCPLQVHATPEKRKLVQSLQLQRPPQHEHQQQQEQLEHQQQRRQSRTHLRNHRLPNVERFSGSSRVLQSESLLRLPPTLQRMQRTSMGKQHQQHPHQRNLQNQQGEPRNLPQCAPARCHLCGRLPLRLVCSLCCSTALQQQMWCLQFLRQQHRQLQEQLQPLLQRCSNSSKGRDEKETEARKHEEKLRLLLQQKQIRVQQLREMRRIREGRLVEAENMQSHLLFLRRQQRNSLIKLLLTADKLEKSCRTTTNRISTQQKLTRRLNGHNRAIELIAEAAVAGAALNWSADSTIKELVAMEVALQHLRRERVSQLLELFNASSLLCESHREVGREEECENAPDPTADSTAPDADEPLANNENADWLDFEQAFIIKHKGVSSTEIPGALSGSLHGQHWALTCFSMLLQQLATLLNLPLPRQLYLPGLEQQRLREVLHSHLNSVRRKQQSRASVLKLIEADQRQEQQQQNQILPRGCVVQQPGSGSFYWAPPVKIERSVVVRAARTPVPSNAVQAAQERIGRDNPSSVSTSSFGSSSNGILKSHEARGRGSSGSSLKESCRVGAGYMNDMSSCSNISSLQASKPDFGGRVQADERYVLQRQHQQRQREQLAKPNCSAASGIGFLDRVYTLATGAAAYRKGKLSSSSCSSSSSAVIGSSSSTNKNGSSSSSNSSSSSSSSNISNNIRCSRSSVNGGNTSRYDPVSRLLQKGQYLLSSIISDTMASAVSPRASAPPQIYAAVAPAAVSPAAAAAFTDTAVSDASKACLREVEGRQDSIKGNSIQMFGPNQTLPHQTKTYEVAGSAASRNDESEESDCVLLELSVRQQQARRRRQLQQEHRLKQDILRSSLPLFSWSAEQMAAAVASATTLAASAPVSGSAMAGSSHSCSIQSRCSVAQAPQQVLSEQRQGEICSLPLQEKQQRKVHPRQRESTRHYSVNCCRKRPLGALPGVAVRRSTAGIEENTEEEAPGGVCSKFGSLALTASRREQQQLLRMHRLQQLHQYREKLVLREQEADTQEQQGIQQLLRLLNNNHPASPMLLDAAARRCVFFSLGDLTEVAEGLKPNVFAFCTFQGVDISSDPPGDLLGMMMAALNSPDFGKVWPSNTPRLYPPEERSPGNVDLDSDDWLLVELEEDLSESRGVLDDNELMGGFFFRGAPHDRDKID